MKTMTDKPDSDPVVVTHNLPNLAGTADVSLRPPAARASSWQLLARGPVNKLCLAIVCAYILIGFASLLPAPSDVPGLRSIQAFRSIHSFDELTQYKYDSTQDYAAPSWFFTDSNGNRHFSPATWFGLDIEGRSVFWRVLYGARTALLITVCTSVLALSIGTVMGIVAGYYGGWIDDIITWFYSVLSTVPWILLVLAVTYVLQQNAALDNSDTTSSSAIAGWIHSVLPSDIVIVILALGLTDWVGLCRLIRGEVLKLRDSDMVIAGRALGLTEPRILFRHILPNVSHLIIITFTLGAIGYVQVEVVLAFLGVGVTSKPSWGRMIDDARLALMRGVWWELAASTAAIFIICMALTILGDALRDALDPKLRGRD
jgi:ABC-type dipeptide/oligopeptide/nickel transport system permease subunit